MSTWNNLIKFLNLRTLACIGLFILTFFNLYYTDGDFFWQIKTGQYIFENLSIPSVDIFSYTKEGQPWFVQEWGYELIIYTLYRLSDSLVFIKFFITTIAILLLFINYKIVKQFNKNSYFAFFLAYIFWIPSTMGVAFRPHMLTYLFFILTLRILLYYSLFPKTKIIWWLPIIFFLWVNVHAAFLLGVILLLIFLLAEFIQLKFNGNFFQSKSAFYSLLFCSFISILATLLNPYFVNEWIYPFQVISLKVLNNNVSEWQGLDFHSFSSQVLLALILLTLFTAIFSKRKPSLFVTFIFFSFLFLAFTAQRHLPLAMFAMTPFAAITIYHFPYKLLFKHSFSFNLSQKFLKFKSLGGDLGHKEYFLNWMILFLMIISSIYYYPKYKIIEDDEFNKKFPVKEVEYIASHHLNGKILNDVNIGGFILYKIPHQKVFYDGRLDVYGDDFANEYFKMIHGSPDWEEIFNSYHFDYVLIPRNLPLRQLLLMRGDFKLTVDSDKFSLLVSKDLAL
ncbi:MAG: hypothetical protein RLZ10_480 [Bacteroidota bacterium]|jgi:hypothetical protein